MNDVKKMAKRPTRTAIALAVASAISVMVIGPAGAEQRPSHNSDSSYLLQKQAAVEGPIFLGPIEAVRANGNSIDILGTRVDVAGLADNLLPAQYVAIFGTVTGDGKVSARSVRLIDDVYAPGSSPVIFTGPLSNRPNNDGYARIGSVVFNGAGLPIIEHLATADGGSMMFGMGTQAISGAAIDPVVLVSFAGSGSIELRGIGVDAIDGSGVFSAGGSELDGEITVINANGVFAIDGSGASIQAIDGSGALIQAIDGSGASIQAIDGSGASAQAIDGSGASIQAIDGSGASIQAIDGSGASIQAIDGSGASVQAIDGSGASVQAIDGSGASVQAIDGSGASVQAIDGSGASVQAIDGSGASVQAIDGSGASVQAIDGSGASVQAIDGSGASWPHVPGH
jgi:hypothetical protein